jgi:phosphatidylglycerol lysyltransferase
LISFREHGVGTHWKQPASNLPEVLDSTQLLSNYGYVQAPAPSTAPTFDSRGVCIFVPQERRRASRIVEQHARSPVDIFKLSLRNSYAFSASNNCVIAYQVANNIAMALGDPLGPENEAPETLRQFLHICKRRGWEPALYRARPDLLPVYRDLDLKKLKIGDDAIVALSDFSLEGKSKRDLRSKARQFQEAGIEVVDYQPPLSPNTIAQLKSVSDEWLTLPRRRERTFTVGHFDPVYLRSTAVLAVVDLSGTILAFINLVPINPTEITGDLMRRRTNVPNGIMDYLFVKFFQYARARGYSRVSLGMAPMTGFKEKERATIEERAIHGLFQKFNFLFNFRGLYRYKAKFATSWEPRYLVYRSFLQLPRIAWALHQLSEIKSQDDEPHLSREMVVSNR